MSIPVTMTTYKRADGHGIGGEYGWVTDMESVDADADGADEPIEFVEEVWVRQSVRTFQRPVCSECDEPATHWGLCRQHAMLDDPDSFKDEAGPA